MCGIVGYIGQQDVKDILLNGLEKLEYRGYDSAGIAVVNEAGVHIFKDKGRIAHLRTVVDETVLSTVGIGHTRWATHGAPNQRNSHPHQSSTGRFTIVHNGVIENELELRQEFLPNYNFISDTDTEVIAALIEHFVLEKEDVELAIRHVMSLLHGSYALGVIDANNPEVLYAAKNKSPMLIGLGEGFNMIGSDAMAMLQCTNQFVEIEDEEFIKLTREGVTIYNLLGVTVKRDPFTAELDASDNEKGTYPHYMLKEIDEQPYVIRRIVEQYFEDGEIKIDQEIVKAVKEADRLYIIAAGTSMHAGFVGKQMFEQLAGIPTEVHISSEFVYNTPVIAIVSQESVNLNTRSNVKEVKARGANTVIISLRSLSSETDQIVIDDVHPLLTPLVTVVPTQLISYYAALQRGFDIDKPRNLAKSVTVE